MCIRTLKNIPQGAEITVSYGDNYCKSNVFKAPSTNADRYIQSGRRTVSVCVRPAGNKIKEGPDLQKSSGGDICSKVVRLREHRLP